MSRRHPAFSQTAFTYVNMPVTMATDEPTFSGVSSKWFLLYRGVNEISASPNKNKVTTHACCGLDRVLKVSFVFFVRKVTVNSHSSDQPADSGGLFSN